MHEPVAVTSGQTVVVFSRMLAAVDALSSVVAGFALLAGARAFMFIALLGWREPVLSGAGLVLLALVGWLRWQCGGAVSIVLSTAPPTALLAAQGGRPATCRANGPYSGAVVAAGQLQPPCTEARDVACYNRPKQCDSMRCMADVERPFIGHARTRA